MKATFHSRTAPAGTARACGSRSNNFRDWSPTDGARSSSSLFAIVAVFFAGILISGFLAIYLRPVSSPPPLPTRTSSDVRLHRVLGVLEERLVSLERLATAQPLNPVISARALTLDQVHTRIPATTVKVESFPATEVGGAQPIFSDEIPKIVITRLDNYPDISQQKVDLAVAESRIATLREEGEKLREALEASEREVACLNKDLLEARAALHHSDEASKSHRAKFDQDSERLARSIFGAERQIADLKARLMKFESFAADREALLTKARELKTSSRAK